jgi:hypothetical protein
MLHISLNALYALLAAKKIPSTRIGGKKKMIRIPLLAVQQFISDAMGETDERRRA